MPSPTLILASGHGPKSLSDWLSASVSLRGSLQLDVRYVHRSSYGISGSESCEVKFLFRSRPSRWPSLVLLPMNSGWLLTSWCVRQGDKRSLEMFGSVGEVVGGEPQTRFITKLGPI